MFRQATARRTLLNEGSRLVLVNTGFQGPVALRTTLGDINGHAPPGPPILTRHVTEPASTAGTTLRSARRLTSPTTA